MNDDLEQDRQDEFPGHYIPPNLLCVGLYVHLDLGWMQHPFAFRSFKIKDEEQIRKIQALNLKQIRYDPMRSDVIPERPKSAIATPVILPEKPITPDKLPTPPVDRVRQAARLKQLNEAILESNQSFAQNAVKVREVVSTLTDMPERSKVTAEKLINDMVNSVITESDVALHAINSNGRGEQQFVHPLNVTILALMLARSLDMSEEGATILGLAALFHDVGKEETTRNKSFLDLHCETGAKLMQRSGFSERISEIIMQHHECMDGTGFPQRLRGDKIDALARLLALVNHFDNLCNPTLPYDALTPYEALSKMYVSYPEKFDPTMLKLLVRLLGVYPPGSIVQLSNGLYGIVLTSNPDKPLLPQVMLYLPKVARETPIVIDLCDEVNLDIKRCLKPEQLPREAFDYLAPRKRISFYFLKRNATDDADPGSAAVEESPALLARKA